MTESSANKRTLERNITKYYVAMFFRNLWISMPIGILYYQYRGLSFVEMGILEAIIAGIVIFSDIPSGAFADIFGRKLSFGLGMTLWGVSLIITGAFSQYWVYLIASVIMGFSDSLISGADKALFYDTLKNLGREGDYLKYTGKKDLIGAVAVILSSIMGGLLYALNPSLPLYAHGIASLIGATIVFLMHEPKITETSKTVKTQVQLIFNSVKFTWQKKVVRFITIFSILVLVVPMIFVNMMEQLYLVEIGVPVVYFGLIFAFTRGVIGFFGPLRYKIEEKLGERGSFYTVTIIFGITSLLMVIFPTPISIAFLFIYFFTRDYTWSILDKYANDHIPSEKRATVLSIMNFGLNFADILAAVLVGYGLDHLKIGSLSSTLSIMLVMSGFFVFLILFLIFSYRKNGNTK